MRIDDFMVVYVEELTRAVTDYPDSYAYPVGEVPDVAGRMRAAFIKGSYNKDGMAIKRTCKRLGIKHTYRDINGFLGG